MITARNGAECLQIMSAEHFNLMILDVIMPEMNGIEVLRKIKNKYKGTEVVMTAGYADKEKLLQNYA